MPAGLSEEKYPVCKSRDVKEGKAYILATVDGEGRKRYEIEIFYIALDSKDRNFSVKVTDEALLSKTGGIVQGMSGSPIIQDGKFVGAVTHVLVNDPARGYGIFIENMLRAAA
jgi:stage IV sporulation protein B